MSTSLHHRAVEHLGTRIVGGTLPTGHVMLAEHLEEELNVSRSVVREAVRVLQSLGLVETIKRVGIRVLPAHRWNPFDPLVIRWRLAGEARGAQLRSLAELRSAVEPVAAELAAGNAPDALRQELMDISLAMREAGDAGDTARFLELDIRFHALVLSGSGNEMFANLIGQVTETLTGRTVHGLMPEHPQQQALQWHIDVAEAIYAGDGPRAREASDQIMRHTIAELAPIWESQPRVFVPVART
ncbi:GntR family transcriptional regulator [Paenarthrobacter ureafaciens]|uniref:FadR/GntR family transcriptional regulator n=1 Tax=Paenarthrobacter ureafaciens TaxID=37931 RepID=UPI0015B8C20C|nr:FCD domain-containing protein [Paenarthrobacter ureafaciens]MEC3853529.1 FCD domain-containing protein [Paenarthrobacter ureafaciens]NWL28647.1 GntR family transcriptional regulator [Paenarthrobacter ureafaciens]